MLCERLGALQHSTVPVCMLSVRCGWRCTMTSCLAGAARSKATALAVKADRIGIQASNSLQEVSDSLLQIQIGLLAPHSRQHAI